MAVAWLRFSTPRDRHRNATGAHAPATVQDSRGFEGIVEIDGHARSEKRDASVVDRANRRPAPSQRVCVRRPFLPRSCARVYCSSRRLLPIKAGSNSRSAATSSASGIANVNECVLLGHFAETVVPVRPATPLGLKAVAPAHVSVNHDPAWKNLADLRPQLEDVRVDRPASVRERTGPDGSIKLIPEHDPPALAHQDDEQCQLVRTQSHLSAARTEQCPVRRNVKRPCTQLVFIALCGHGTRLLSGSGPFVKKL